MLFKNEMGEGIASIDRVAVDVQVFDPVARAGIQFKIPIQNWSLSLFHGYGMERMRTVIDAITGRLLGDDPAGLSAGILEYGQVGAGALIPARMQINRNYHSHRPGFALYMDYRCSIGLRLQARRNVNSNRWVVKGVFTLLLHKYGGIRVATEYSERSVATIRHLTYGPAFMMQFLGVCYTTIPSRCIILSMLERHSVIRKLTASSSGMERYDSGRIGFSKTTFTFL